MYQYVELYSREEMTDKDNSYRPSQERIDSVYDVVGDDLYQYYDTNCGRLRGYENPVDISSAFIKQKIYEGPEYEKGIIMYFEDKIFRGTIQGDVSPYFSDLNNATCKEVGMIGLWRSIDSPHMLGYYRIEAMKKNPEEFLGNWTSDRMRQKLGIKSKAGRVYKKVHEACGKEYIGTSEIEEFLKKFLPQTLEISEVSGESIRHWYHGAQYNTERDTGTLKHSCMRYSSCQGYLDIYVYNPEKVSMIIGTVDDKLCARSLVWKADNGKIYYDRVYGQSLEVGQIEKYAEERGYKPCYCEGINITVSLQGDHDTYPYMDTMKYLSWDRRRLNTYIGEWILEETEGYIEDSNYCECCEEYVSEELTYIGEEDIRVCDRCLEEYYTWSEAEDRYIHVDDCETCNICDSIYSEGSSRLYYDEAHKRTICDCCIGDFIEIAGGFYDEDEVYQCPYCEEWIVKGEECECEESREERERKEEEEEEESKCECESECE